MLSKSKNRSNAIPVFPATRAATFEQEMNFAGNSAPAECSLRMTSARPVQPLVRGRT